MGHQGYFATLPGRPGGLGGDRVLWREAAGERIALLPAIDAAIVSHAGVFRAWGDHIAAISAATRLPRDHVAAVLERARSFGLLTRLEEQLPPGTGAPATAAPPPLVCIRTCARPALLSQLLQSLLDDEQRFGVRRRYVIIDDSPDVGSRAATEAEALGFASRTASEVRLLAAVGQQALLDALGARGGAIESLLLRRDGSPPSGGRAWNWALLLAAGGTLALLDDDFRFPLRLPRGEDGRFELHTAYTTETEFLDSPASLVELPVVEEDPYAVLLRPLGQTAGQLLGQHGFDPASALESPSASLTCLASPARVVGVCTGIYGALNFDSTVYLAGGDAPTMASYLRAPFDSRRMNGDLLWHGRRKPHFMKTGGFTPLALDARDLLPPTGTFGKSDDGLFLALLSNCDPHALMVALPASIGHFPPAGRDRRAAAERSIVEDVSTFCAAMANVVAPTLRSNSRSLRLTAISACLGDLAGSSDAALAGSYLGWRDYSHSTVLQMLYQNAKDYAASAPADWMAHVRRAIAANEETLRQRVIPPAQLALARAALSQLAGTLQAWVSLWPDAGAPLLERVRRLG